MRHHWRLFSALLILTLLLGSLVFILATSAGLRLLLSQVPGLHVSDVQGSLVRGFVLQDVNYQQAALNAKLQKLDFQWKITELLQRRLHLSRLHMEGLRLQLPASAPVPAASTTPAAPTLPALQLPLQVLLDDLQFKDLQIQQGTQQVQIAHLQLSAHTDAGHVFLRSLTSQGLQIEPLLSLQHAEIQADISLLSPHLLRVKKLFLQQLTVTPPPATDAPVAPPPLAHQPKTLTLPELQLPLEIALEQMRVQDFLLQQQPNPLSFKALTLAAHTQDGKLLMSELSLQHLAVQAAQVAQADLQGQLDLRAPHALQLNFAAQAQHPHSGALSLEIQAQGTPQDAHLDAHLSLPGDATPLAVRLNAHAQNLLGGALRWQAQAQVQGVDAQHPLLKTWLPDTPDFQGETQIQAQGDWQQVQFQQNLSAQIAGFGAFSLHLAAENLAHNWQQWRVSELQVRQADAPLQVDAHGSLDLRQAQPQVEAQVRWQGVRVPVAADEKPLVSPQGELKFAGTPAAYAIDLDTRLAAESLPDSRWQLHASGDTKFLKIQQLRADLLDGWGQLSGDLSWLPQPRWDLHLRSQDLNPGKQWADFPGRLALALHSSGQLVKGELQATLEDFSLKGRLRDYPLSLLLSAKMQGQSYEIKELNLQSGQAHMQVRGRINQQVKLDWQLEAPQLAELYPQAQGSVRGQGSLTGELYRPILQAQLTGKKLAFENNHLDNLALDTQLDIKPQGQIRLNLQADGISSGDTRLDQLQVQADGTTEAHTLSLTAKLPTQSAQLRLRGGLRSMNTWQGSLQALQIQDARWGRVQLQQAAALQASAQGATLEQACWQVQSPNLAQPGKLCLQGAWQTAAKGLGEGQAALTLDQVSLTALRPWLPKGLQVQDFPLSLHGHAALNKTGNLSGTVALELGAGEVRLQETAQAEAVTLLKHLGTRLNAQLGASGLQADLKLQLPQQDGIQASFALPALNRLPLADAQPLQGNLKLRFTDFSLLPVFAPQVSEPKAHIEAQAQLSGSLQQPVAQGELLMRDGGLKVEAAGLEIHDLRWTLRSDTEGKIKLDGQLRTGETNPSQTTDATGVLHFNGDAQIAEAWQMQLKLKGERLELMNSPAIWLLASPDLTFSGNPQRLALSGEIAVPEALLTPPETQGGRQEASKDIVIVRDQGSPVALQPAAEKTLPFYTQLRIRLGDKVRVKGMGFKGRLQGDLLVAGKPDKGLTGNGRISVQDGIYKAYGQDLRIRKGQVLYSGGAIENPGLDVQAVRVVAAVTAGIAITGTAQTPELALFSEPALDQTNILSYLVLGRPASGSNSASLDQRQMLAQALTDLALNEDSTLSRTMREDLGLDMAGLDTSGGAEQTTFMLGKYLTPDLYISYGVGLFDAQNVFQMRYRLSRRFSLESATSGGNSGVDLRYTLEH